ncbi:MAG TPA: hypothetical protein VHW43_01735, partial [Puia sp.]|nr:hypothetical protein [Puia sp.]
MNLNTAPQTSRGGKPTAVLILLLFCCNYGVFAKGDMTKPAPTKADTAAPGKPRAMSWKDVPTWKYINPQKVELSPDGKWLAYPMLTTEGEGELILKGTKDTLTRKYPIGGDNQVSFAFSEDGQWIAIKQSSSFKDIRVATRTPGGKQLFDKLLLVNLATGKTTSFDKAGVYAFNGKAATCLALALTREKQPGAKSNDHDPQNSELLLIELKTGKIQDIGDVGEFAFNKPGTFLAYTTETPGKTGNGLYLLSVATRQTTIIDNDQANYKSLNWKEEGEAFAALKMKKDSSFKTLRGLVIGVKDPGPSPAIIIYDPAKDPTAFPKGMTISGNRAPSWSDDLSRLFFGIAALKPEKKPVLPGDSLAKKNAGEDTVKPDMIIWSGKDIHLQSRQQVEEKQDAAFSWYGMVDVANRHFTRLNDSAQRSLTLLPKSHY